MNSLVLALALAAPPGSATAPSGSAGTDVPLANTIKRQWKFRLPAEAWRRVGTQIELGGGLAYRVQLDGTTLAIDTDGDERFDARVEADGVVVLGAGKARTAVRLRAKPEWSYMLASVKTCKIGGTKVTIVDQNNNGRFDEVGVDAMLIGRSKTASFLSSVVPIGGALHTIEVAADGSKVTHAPYEGESGELQLVLRSEAKTLAMILRSVDGRYSFDVARAKGAIKLPLGSYKLHSGLLSYGGNRVSVAQGRAADVQLKKGECAKLELGGPLDAEFAYQRKAGKMHFSPQQIWFYGRAGEQYVDWQPLGSSPKITIDDALKNKRLADVIFPPNC